MTTIVLLGCLILFQVVWIVVLIRDHLALQDLADAQRARIHTLETEVRIKDLNVSISDNCFQILKAETDRLRANQNALLYHGYRIPVHRGARLLLWAEPVGWTLLWRN